VRDLLARFKRQRPIEMREYESFESALHDSDSYEDPRLIEIVREKTRRYRQFLATADKLPIESRQLIQNLFILRHVELAQPLNVLEVGGACGASYFETRTLLPGRIEHWSIVETPAMAAAGESVADDSKLTFHPDIASATKQLASRDIAIAQGVLQYTGTPLQVLNELFALEFSYVYITRTVVADVAEPVFTRQETDLSAHGPGRLPGAPESKSSQPMTLVSCEALMEAIPERYEVVFRFNESEEQSLSIRGREVRVRDIGFLAQKV
jgi:putative methyltransferase (TIGR04325 family)